MVASARLSTAYLGIGSNVEVKRNIQCGIAALRQAFGNLDLSPVYRSVAVGFAGEDFINLAARIETSLSPLELKEFLNDLEDRHGRNRELPKFSDRTLDVDILLFDDLWLHCPGLVLPRPDILHYAHVLRPLAELAPDVVHPVAGIPMAHLWREFAGERSGLTPSDLLDI